MQRIGQVGMAAGKLPNGEYSSLAGKMQAQEGLELCQVQLFSGADGSRMILKISHRSSPVRLHRGIIEMGERIKRAHGKALARENKFAVGTVLRHPGNAQRILRRQIERALHGQGDWPARSENRQTLSWCARRKESFEAAPDTSGKCIPGFNTRRRKFSAHPQSNHGLKDFLKRLAAFRGILGSFEGLV